MLSSVISDDLKSPFVVTTSRDWEEAVSKCSKLKRLVGDVIEIGNDWKTLEKRAREIQERPVVCVLTTNELVRLFLSMDSRILLRFRFCIDDADERTIDMDLIRGHLRTNPDLCSKCFFLSSTEFITGLPTRRVLKPHSKNPPFPVKTIPVPLPRYAPVKEDFYVNQVHRAISYMRNPSNNCKYGDIFVFVAGLSFGQRVAAAIRCAQDRFLPHSSDGNYVASGSAERPTLEIQSRTASH
jgi:hypothetical protein